MTRTPGILARRVAGTWTMDGSYILRVPTFSQLPGAPADDDVFAFVHDTEKLYRSRAGSWVEFTSGGGSSSAGYFAANIISQAVPNTLTTLKVGTPGLSNGFTLLGDGTVRCDVAGTYVVTACVSMAAGPGNWQILNLLQLRGATTVRTWSVVGQGSVNANLGTEPSISNAFTLAVGDVVLVQAQADTTGRVTDGNGRSTFVISAVGGPKGDKGDAGTTSAGYFAAPLGPIVMAASTDYELPVGAVILSSGFSKSGTTRVQCDRAGIYHVVAGVTCNGATTQWVILSVIQYRGTNVVSRFDFVGGNYAGGGFALNTPTAVFDLLANDQIVCLASSSGANTIDGRSRVTISAVGGPKGDPGSLGTAKLDDLSDVTIPAGSPTDRQHLIFDAASAQWKATANGVGTIVHHGSIAIDLGSQTSGGLRDLVSSNAPTFPYPTNIHAWGYVSIGFGVAAVVCDIDLVRIRDGGVYDAVVGHAGSAASISTRYPIQCFDNVAANVNPNVKSRCNGVNFNGGNCYMSGRLDWIITAA